jgi:hypothetical protein
MHKVLSVKVSLDRFFRATITGAVKESDHHVYYIRIEYGDMAWVVKRRYSDFAELHSKVHQIMKAIFKFSLQVII